MPGRSGELLALDAATGVARWSRRLPPGVRSTPAVSGGVVYVGTGSPGLCRIPWRFSFAALDVLTGELRWRRRLSSPVAGQPLVDGDSVFFGAEDGVLRCLSAERGELRWQCSLHSPLRWAPASEGRLFVGTAGGELSCLDPSSGEQRWCIELPGAIERRVDVHGSHLSVVTSEGWIFLVNVDGQVLWERLIAGHRPSAPRAWRGLVLLGGGSPDEATSGLYALDITDGRIRFFVPVRGWARGCPHVEGDAAYLGTTYGAVAIDLRQGLEQWTFDTEGHLYSSPTGADGRLFLVAQDACYAVTTAALRGEAGT